MAVTVKSARELALMRDAGKMLAEVHEKLSEVIKPGITTLEIDTLGEKLIRSYGCIPNFLNYNGYPASICVSVNDEVIHGIPSKDKVLMEGDIVSLGDKIGVIGDTTVSEMADEPHLHFEMFVSGASVNPLDYFTEESKKSALGIVSGEYEA
jgi:methionine aminopeptidase